MTNKSKRRNNIRSWMGIRELLSFCRVDGRNVERARGTLQLLQPLEYCEDCLETGVLHGAQEIDQFVQEVRHLQGT